MPTNKKSKTQQRIDEGVSILEDVAFLLDSQAQHIRQNPNEIDRIIQLLKEAKELLCSNKTQES